MARYLVLWEVDLTKVPLDRKERAAGWAALMNMVRQDREKGLIKDWGEFLGGNKGYAIDEGSELDVMKAIQQYVPFVKFEVHQVASESQVNEMIKAISG